MVVQDGKFEVICEGAVTVICAKNSMHNNLPYIKSEETIGITGVNFHILPEGYKYDLERREPIPPNVKEVVKES